MATPIISLTPVIFLENQEDAAVSAAVLRVSIKLGDDGRCSADLEINNWGSQNGVTGYLFFQDERFARGKGLKINAGSLTLFDGLITSVKARYPQSAAPTIGLTATTRRVFNSSNAIQMALGQQLIEFDVKESWQAGKFWGLFPGRQSVGGKGLAEFDGQLTPGTTADLAGLGDRFEGHYRIRRCHTQLRPEFRLADAIYGRAK